MQGHANTRTRTADVLGDAPSFRDLLLPPELVETLYKAGFIRPSPVQQAAIPLARLGSDIIIQAKAGTGKTLVFSVALAERINRAATLPQALVLAPTREVALQAADVISLMAGDRPLAVAALIGGLPTAEDERVLRRRCHVVVGTPGRILSLIQRGSLITQGMQVLVLDEADKLLSEAFKDDVTRVIAAVPSHRQVLALSATYTPFAEAQLIALMRSPHSVMLCEGGETSLLGVGHYVMDVLGSSGGSGYGTRQDALLRMLSSISFHQAVVFCNTKSGAEDLAAALAAAGHSAACLSSAKDQLQRIEVLNALRGFQLRAVVATDVAARGVDLEGVNLVVNYDLPSDSATLMHRVGRAGRFGTRGAAVSMVSGAAEREALERALTEAGGGEVHELPDPIPAGWTAGPPSREAHSRPEQPSGEDRVVIKAAAPMHPMPSQVRSSGTAPLQSAVDVDCVDVLSATLWPEDAGPLPKPVQWPLQLSDLMPSVSLARPSVQATAAASEGRSGDEIDLSYTVLPSSSAEAPSHASAGQKDDRASHYAAVIKSLELDLQGTPTSRAAAVSELKHAFKSSSVSPAVTLPERTERNVSEPGKLQHRQQRPLTTAQATSYARQLEQEEAAQALEEEAAQLEVMAHYGDLDEEEDYNYNAVAENVGGGGDAEQAWRQYWMEHYRQHGCWPGGAPGEEANAAPSSPTMLPPAQQPPLPAPFWPPPHPRDAAGVVQQHADGGGYVRVPAQLLQRYFELEWRDWRQRYFGDVLTG